MWPTNEAETIELYKLVQKRLGWSISHLQTAFPDAVLESEDGDRLVVEFEYLSKNFKQHGHDPNGCQLIVCWVDNWSDAPLPVQALSDCAEMEANAVSVAIKAREDIWQAKIDRWWSEAHQWRIEAMRLQRGLASLRQRLSRSAEKAKKKLVGDNPLFMLNDEAFGKATAAVFVRVMARLDAQLVDFE